MNPDSLKLKVRVTESNEFDALMAGEYKITRDVEPEKPRLPQIENRPVIIVLCGVCGKESCPSTRLEYA